MSEPTPGPWGLVWDDDVVRIRLNGSTVYQVSDVTDPEFPFGRPRCNLDDMRLIAAAPELLAACKRLLPLWEEAIGWEDDYMDMADDARAAIAKAEGRGE
ncbi:MAG: hypothetical protein EBR82_63525 [Caulobacteraceae bacterium]|nr:hypothetical protein [Caulobacteraceae bacterium]